MIKRKNKKQIKKMKKAGQLAADILTFIEPYVKPGVTTGKLNKLCHDFMIEHNSTPATLNYGGFPSSICTSINEVVCHGIPSYEEKLKEGDIVNIDVTPKLNGYHGDTSKTFMVGEVSEKARQLVQRTEKAMFYGIEAVKPGVFLYEVGKAIENYVKEFGYSIVRAYGGHGIGKKFHEDPHVLHYFSFDNKIKLKPGMTFTIEPMINMGKSFKVETSTEDGWTVRTKDGSLSAQFEHTVLVTKSGYEILTLPKEG